MIARDHLQDLLADFLHQPLGLSQCALWHVRPRKELINQAPEFIQYKHRGKESEESDAHGICRVTVAQPGQFVAVHAGRTMVPHLN